MTSVISEKIARLLIDKDTEKRRQGATEIEQRVKVLSSEKKREACSLLFLYSKSFFFVVLGYYSSNFYNKNFIY